MKTVVQTLDNPKGRGRPEQSKDKEEKKKMQHLEKKDMGYQTCLIVIHSSCETPRPKLLALRTWGLVLLPIRSRGFVESDENI